VSSVAISGINSPAYAEERSLFFKSTETKGYGKRDRVLLGSEQSISPSQLHEVYGARVDAGVQTNTATARYPGEKASSTSPSVTLRGFWSGDIIALGIGATGTESNLDSNNNVDFSEKQTSQKLLPAVALTVTPNLTLGASSDVNWIDIKQNSAGQSSQSYEGYTRRESLGVSFHTPKLEVGVAYATPSTASLGPKNTNLEPVGFGLLSASPGAEREIYLPSHATIFARGNLTNHFSLQGAVSHVQYDNNVAGAKDSVSAYRIEDRLASQLQAVYWLSDYATRFAATGSYRGATFAPIGTEENGLGYRDANLYGLELDGAIALRKRTYLGLTFGYLRGERDQTTDGARFVAREERTKIASTININL